MHLFNVVFYIFASNSKPTSVVTSEENKNADIANLNSKYGNISTTP